MAEIPDVYFGERALPAACLGANDNCPLDGCLGLQEARVTERVYRRAGAVVATETGAYCPHYQVSTPDGSIYHRTPPSSQ